MNITQVNSLCENNEPFITKIQKLDRDLYGGMGAEDWVVYTFGAKAGFMAVIMKNNKIISFSQVVGCVEGKKAQLWGLGTKKEYQNKGFGTLTYKLSKEICKKFGKNKVDVNVEPENVSNKIYSKDRPEIVAFGKYYPDESPRLILSVSLTNRKIPDISQTFAVGAYDYTELKKVLNKTGKKYLLDWSLKENTPYLLVGMRS